LGSHYLRNTAEIKRRIAENDFEDYDSKILEAIKLLEPVSVKVPYARVLQYFVSNESPIVRTYFHKIVDYIKFSASIHQKSRHVMEVAEQKYVVANEEDYENARQVLNEMISNDLMVTLTNNEKDIIDYIVESKNSVSAKDISVRFEYSERYARDGLKTLAEYGMLDFFIEKGDEGRKLRKYAIKAYNKFNLPKFNPDWMRDGYEPSFVNGIEETQMNYYSKDSEEPPEVKQARDFGVI
jgi:hypothetical protein